MRCPPFPGGLRLSSEGINTLFKHAQQQGTLAKVMPPALLALPDHPLARALASVFCCEHLPAMPILPAPAGLLWRHPGHVLPQLALAHYKCTVMHSQIASLLSTEKVTAAPAEYLEFVALRDLDVHHNESRRRLTEARIR